MVQVRSLFGFVLILLASFIVNLFAAGSPDTVIFQPVMRAFPLTGEITLDGRVQEEFWQAAESATGFTQNQPNEGEPATEKTEVRILFTKDKLYLGVICWDSQPDQIVVTQGRRDGDLNDTDSILILLDTYDDDRQATGDWKATPVSATGRNSRSRYGTIATISEPNRTAGTSPA